MLTEQLKRSNLFSLYRFIESGTQDDDVTNPTKFRVETVNGSTHWDSLNNWNYTEVKSKYFIIVVDGISE